MTRRRFSEGKLVLASHNAGKLKEIAALLAPFAIEVVSAASLDLPEPEETGSSFTENAVLKAAVAAKLSGLPALADDSGLAVDALDGQPGIYSARWAGPDRDFALAMRKIEDLLIGQDDRRAHFVCALALAWPDGHSETVEGTVDGRLVWPPRGGRGFGYDPVFVADGQELTFGELDPVTKHRISHRADAFTKLVAACFES